MLHVGGETPGNEGELATPPAPASPSRVPAPPGFAHPPLRRWLSGVLPMALLATPCAALAAVLLHGRTWPHTATAAWWVTFAASACMLFVWWMRAAIARADTEAALTTAAAHAARSFWPLALCAPLLLLLYASEPVHHAFVFWPRVRVLMGAAVVAALYGARLALARPRTSPTAGMRALLCADARWAVPLSLLVVGAMQATTYIDVAADDLGRYGTIADALRAGMPYPVWRAGPGTAQAGTSGAWTDLPAYPLALVVAFAVLGHTYAAAHLPLVLANFLFPLVLFHACLAATGRRLVSFLVAVATASFPLFQVYTLGATEPDALFASLLSLLALTTIRAGDEGSMGRQTWWAAAAGLAAAAVALTRPEGPLYAGLVPGWLLIRWLSQRSRQPLTAFLVAAVPLVSLFSLVSWQHTGRIWPQAPRELTPSNLLTNVALAGAEAWPFYARQLLLTPASLALAALALLLVAGIGVTWLWRCRPALAGLPVALFLNTLLLLMLDAYSLRTGDVTELYRHASQGTPLLALLVGCGAVGVGRLVRARLPAVGRPLAGAAAAAATVVVTVWIYLLATPEEIYARPGQGSLLRQDVYVLWTDLWSRPYPLPDLRFGNAPPSLRDELVEFYRPYDLHGVDRGYAFQLAAWLAFVAGLWFVLADESRSGKPRQPPLLAPYTQPRPLRSEDA